MSPSVDPYETAFAETRLSERLSRIPESALRSELLTFLDELFDYCAEPSCAEMQGDGAPCGTILTGCDGCAKCVGKIRDLRSRLKG